jgi:uncharacterized protein YndB with AHSA1/START domain
MLASALTFSATILLADPRAQGPSTMTNPISPQAATAERAITAEIVVEAPIAAVWEAWSTAAGIRSFFARDAVVELRPGGAYEMLFDPTAPVGERGGEGNQVLAVEAPHLLSFTWNAPPSLPTVRHQRTHVTVRLTALDDSRTRVVLCHDGWGTGGEWDAAFAYFERAWDKAVLPWLAQRFVEGPRVWPAQP